MTQDQKIVLGVYGGFLIGLISNFIPLASVQILGGLVLLLSVPAAYIIRRKKDEGSFAYSHMHFLIRTFWIASLFLVIGIIASIIFGDHSKINAVVEGITHGMIFTQVELNAILMNYAFDNIVVFSLTIGSSLLYLGYRVVKGIIIASKNLSISDAKSWF